MNKYKSTDIIKYSLEYTRRSSIMGKVLTLRCIDKVTLPVFSERYFMCILYIQKLLTKNTKYSSELFINKDRSVKFFKVKYLVSL